MFYGKKSVRKIILCLISVLLFFLFGFTVSASNEEESLKQEYKIQLLEKEVDAIVKTLIQKITNESIDTLVLLDNPEREAILALLRRGIQLNSFNYLITQAPKEIVGDFVKAGTKMAPIFLDFGFSSFWEMGVNEAKKYAIEWLLKNELRTGGGNFPFSYKTYTGKVENVSFPFILLYNPKNNKIEINIYSSREIETPEVTRKYLWTGGVKKLSPFIVNISGAIEKNQYGVYIWKEGPKIEIDFPSYVPEFQFQKPSFAERQINLLKDQLYALYLAGEKIDHLLVEVSGIASNVGNAATENAKSIGGKIIGGIVNFFSNLNSIISILNPFQASMFSWSEEDSYGPSPHLLIRQKAEEILSLIKEAGFSIEEEYFFEEDETDLDALWARVREMDEMIKELQDRIVGSIKEAEEDLVFLEDLEDLETVAEICSVDINTASKEDLQKLTGIGPTYADRIIEKRPFSSVNDLIRVSGIGEVTLEKILEQGCAFVDDFYYTNSGSGNNSGSTNNEVASPLIILNYEDNNPINKDISIEVVASNLQSSSYDVKISIENEGTVLSNIYDIKEEKWKSSVYYLNNAFSGTSFTGNFSLKIKEDKKDFRGEAEIIVKLRNSIKGTIVAEKRGKINIIDEENDEEDNEQNYVSSYWPVFQQNSQRTGQANILGPANFNNPSFDIFLEGSDSNDYFYAPAIDSENNLYFKAKLSGREGIFSFNYLGEERWYYEGGMPHIIGPIVTPSEDIFFYIKGKEFPLILYNKEGNLLWEKPLNGSYLLGYLAAYKNTIYSLASSGGPTGKLISIDIETGEINWIYETGEILSTSNTLTIGEDGTAYFGNGNIFYAININGEEKWIKTFEGIDGSSPVIRMPSISDETIYLTVSQIEKRGSSIVPCLFALNSENATEEWRVCDSYFKFNHISVSTQNNIYIPAGKDQRGRIFKFNSSGVEEWQFSDSERTVEILIIDSEENIYGIFGGSLLRAFNKNGEMRWQYSLYPAYRIKSLSFDGNGNIYIGGHEKMYIVRNKETIEEPKDNVSPEIIFELESVQNSLSFILSWLGEDLAQEEVEPSGISGYQLRYSQDEENWTYLPSEEDYIEETEFEFTGEEDNTYYFEIRAKDNEGNISEWVSASTTISLLKNLLIVEVQVAGEKASHDFIKIYNPNNFDIDIDGYKLRKRNAAGNEDSIRLFPSESIIVSKEYYLWASSQDEDYPLLINADTWTTQTISNNNSVALLNKDDEVLSALAWGSSNNPFVEGTSFPENPEKNEILKRIWNEETGEYSNIGDNSLDFEIQ